MIQPPPVTNPHGLSVGTRAYACVIDGSEVKCWGDPDSYGYRLPSPPTLSNPKQVAVGFNHACAIVDSGVVCWGKLDFEILSPRPSFKNPRRIASGGEYNCFEDDDGLRCWGHLGFLGDAANTPPSFANVKDFFIDHYHACVLDDGGVKCWGNLGPTYPKILVVKGRKLMTAGLPRLAFIASLREMT